MIRKGKLMKSTAIALAIISVFGSSLSSVSAAEIVKSTGTEVVEYDAVTAATTGNGSTDSSTEESTSKNEQDITYKVFDGEKDITSHIRTNSSKLITVGDKKYIELTLPSGSFYNYVEVQVNDKDKERATTTLNEETNILTVLFEIGSLEDEINIMFNYTVPNYKTMEHGGRFIAELAKIEEDITYKVFDGEKDITSHIRTNSSKLITVGNKKYIELTLPSGSFYNYVEVQVNDKDKERATTTLNEETNILTVLFEIGSLEDEINIMFNYTVPNYKTMEHGGRFVAELASNDNDSDETTPDTENDSNVGGGTTTPDTENDSNTGDNIVTPDTENDLKDGNYTINITTPSSMGGQFLADLSNIEVKNGKIYATLNMSGASLMSNINAKVNGKVVEFVDYEKNGDNAKFTVEIPNLDAKITLGMYVEAMGRNVEFEVSLNKETLKEVTTDSDSSDSDNNSNNKPNNNGSSSNGGSSNDDTTSSEDTVVEGTTVKEYTIQNEVIYDNEIGYNMVRQYLDKATKIEKINGRTYATLTFTGVDLMNSHKVYVNGSLVNHTIVSKTSDAISIRFEISDINDNIEVQLFVVPMNKTVKFGVELLEDTLTFVKEYPLENNEGNTDVEGSTDENETLPQTGSAFGSEMLLGLGGLLTASGALLRKKRK